MASEPEEGNETSSVPLTEESIRDAAADYPVTVDDVKEAVVHLQEKLEGQLNSLYERAWLEGGPQTLLTETPEGPFFAMTAHDVADEFERGTDADLINAVVSAHQNSAAIWGFDVDRPTAYSNTYETDFSPIFVEFPGNWKRAQYHARVRMMYLLHHDLTPAEALDFWGLKSGHGSLSTNQNESKWRASRDVDHEATYKTIRQAKEKLGDPEKQPYYEKQNIEITEVRDEE